MSDYIIFSLVEDKEKEEYILKAANFAYEKGEQAKLKNTFLMKCDLKKADKLYYAFEDFCFKNKSPKIVYWGKYHFLNLKKVIKEAGANEWNLGGKENFINLQESFKNHLRMKRFVKFFYAYEKIAGIGRLKLKRDYEFYELEHMIYFFGYSIGDKFFKRMDKK